MFNRNRTLFSSFFITMIIATQSCQGSLSQTLKASWLHVKDMQTSLENHFETNEKKYLAACTLIPMAAYLIKLYARRLPQGAPLMDPDIDERVASFLRNLCISVNIDPDTIYVRIIDEPGLYFCIPAHHLVLITRPNIEELTALLNKEELSEQDKTAIAIHAGCFLHELGHIRNEGTITQQLKQIGTLSAFTALSLCGTHALLKQLPTKNKIIQNIVASLLGLTTQILWAYYYSGHEQCADDAVPAEPTTLRALARLLRWINACAQTKYGKLYPVYAAYQTLFDTHPNSLTRAAKLEERADEIEEHEKNASRAHEQPIVI